MALMHQSSEKRTAAPSPDGQQNPSTSAMPPIVAQRQSLGKAMQMKRDAENAEFFPDGIPQRMNTLPFKQEADGPGLPQTVQPKMESAFGADFSSVKVHQNSSSAKSMGAKAFTQGEDVHFAPGEFDTQSPKGQALIGHELTHVVQQRAGRVPATRQMKGANVNADPKLEQEADEMGKKAATGDLKLGSISGSDAPPPANISTTIQGAGLKQDEDEDAIFITPAVENLPTDAPIQKADPDDSYVARTVTIDRKMTGEEFKVAALTSLFGGNPPKVEWQNVHPSYDPKDNPFTVQVSTKLVLGQRAANNAALGIGAGGGGKIEFAEERAKEFQDGKPTKTKQELLSEMDRRYYRDTGQDPKRKLTGSKSDEGNRKLWLQIQDEVLFQNEYIHNLPPEVKRLIKITTDGKVITPEEIEKLFLIAKKIEGMETADVLDYASKVNSSTTDLKKFEESLDAYIKDKAEETKERTERIVVQDKLAGNEDLYALWNLWKSPYSPPGIPHYIGRERDLNPRWEQAVSAEKARRETALLQALKAKGFDSIAQFEKYISDFEVSFQKAAVRVVLDILARYEGMLYQEGQRYQDPKEIQKFYDSLEVFRVKNTEAARLRGIGVPASRQENPGNLPNSSYDPEKGKIYMEAADREQKVAIAEINALKPKNPVLGEDFLPVDRRLNKTALTQATPDTLGPLLQTHIATRVKDIQEARGRLLAEPEMVFEMPKMLPQFFQALGMADDGLPQQIIKDKIDRINKGKTFVAIVLGILAIALAIISFGTAIPWLAAGAVGAGAVLSSYAVIDEYHKYVVQKDLADVGMADDPSVFWLIVAVVGAGLDMGAAVNAVSKLGKAAKLLETSAGTIDDFSKTVRMLEKSGEIDAKVGQAVEAAARSRKAYTMATEELLNAAGSKLYGGLGPLADLDVYKALFKMAIAKVSEVGSTFEMWLLQLNKMRLDAKLAKLSAEEVEIARKAYEQAKILAASSHTPVSIINPASGKVFGTFSQGKSMEIISKGTKLHGGNVINLHPTSTTTITGRMDDVTAVALRGENLPGATLSGANPGGVNILRSPHWDALQAKHAALKAVDEQKFWRTVTDEFWEVANKPWMEEAVKRGDVFRFVSNPADELAVFATKKGTTEFILDAGGNKIRSIFGREVDMLTANGYKFMPDGTAVKVP